MAAGSLLSENGQVLEDNCAQAGVVAGAQVAPHGDVQLQVGQTRGLHAVLEGLVVLGIDSGGFVRGFLLGRPVFVRLQVQLDVGVDHGLLLRGEVARLEDVYAQTALRGRQGQALAEVHATLELPQ